jgi:hypothetical protein
MPEADFEHEIEIGVPRRDLHAFLLDLSHYADLHPLIESIEEIDRSEALPHARRYRVVDRIPIGPFRFRTAYVAALEPVSEYEVQGHAWQSPGIRLTTRYCLEDIEHGTRLIERCSVSAPLLMRRYVIGQARRAHGETLEKMKRLLEGESRQGES